MGSKKKLYGILQAISKLNLARQKLDIGKKGKTYKIITDSLLIAAQNNALRTNYIKARIDKTHQNSKRRLCRDETMYHIISECHKFAPKESKAGHDWVGKVINWELGKILAFDQTNKWYLQKPEPV